jgi:hypothetical protein
MMFFEVLARRRSAEYRRRSRLGAVAVNFALWVILALGTQTTLSGPARAQDAPRAIAQFTTGVENREPIDQVTFVENDVERVYFFTDLRGLDGRTIKHRWLYNGKLMADVTFEVRGPRWRVWSSKKLLPDWIGDWTVEIVTAEGEVIAADSFTYSPPEA